MDLSALMRSFDDARASSLLSTGVPFALFGVAATLLTQRLLARYTQPTRAPGAGRHRDDGVFNLHHLVLNADIGRGGITAWCNFGYWKREQAGRNDAGKEDNEDEDPLSFADGCAALVRRLALYVHVSPASRILDVGCGCGEQDFLLVREFHARAIDAVNIAPSQIAWAKRRKRYLEEADSSSDRMPIGFHVGSATQLDELDHAFARNAAKTGLVDLVPASVSFTHVLAVDCAYHFPPSREVFFAQALERLEPGGRIGLVDMVIRRPTPNQVDSSGLLQRLVARLGWFVGLRVVSRACHIPLANMVGIDTLVAQLSRAGFVDVEFEDISEHTFEGFAECVERAADGGRGLASLGVDLFRPALWTRFRVVARAMRFIGRRKFAAFVMVRARKPEA